MKKTTLTSFIVLCLFSAMFLACLAFGTTPVEASGTIYIRATGEVEGTGEILSEGDIYTFATDIYDEIIVEKSNIIIDGNGYSLQGNWGGTGFRLYDISNVTIQNTVIKAFSYGIRLKGSSNNTISGNNIADNGDGVLLFDSSNDCSISGNKVTNNSLSGIRIGWGKYPGAYNTSIIKNNITNNRSGIVFMAHSDYNSIYGNTILGNGHAGIQSIGSSNNSVVGNNITANHWGIMFENSLDNSIYHNSFIDNENNVGLMISLVNIWDNGYPSGGNYWSDYAGDDSDRDGIGDASYIINESNTDNHPLMGVFSDFNATSEHHVQTLCNSTISDLKFNGTAINFNVVGENGTTGFCRICIPTALMNNAFRVFVNDTEILPSPEPLPFSNSTHNYLYFTYNHSTQEITIIPEFPSFLILPLFMIAALLAVTLYKRKRSF